jgi:hypothetical protein
MTAYRTDGGEAGLFITLRGSPGEAAFAELKAASEALAAEAGLQLTFSRRKEDPFTGTISTRRIGREHETTTDDQMLAWLRDAANRMVNTFRPRLSAFARSE